ncbi:MAG: hypothetical protein ACN6I7_04495 [bacterium]
MLENAFDGAADGHRLVGVAQQIADEPDVVRLRQFYEHHQIRPVLRERRMHRMPDPLPG